MVTVATFIAVILAGLVLLIHVWVIEARLRAQNARRLKLALSTAIRVRMFGKVAVCMAPVEMTLCAVRPSEPTR